MTCRNGRYRDGTGAYARFNGSCIVLNRCADHTFSWSNAFPCSTATPGSLAVQHILSLARCVLFLVRPYNFTNYDVTLYATMLSTPKKVQPGLLLERTALPLWWLTKGIEGSGA